MRIFLIVIAALAAAWGAYWYYGAQMVEKQAAAFLETSNRPAGGLTHQGVAVGGFPYRFDVELAEPRFQDAARGIGWEAPFLNVHAMAYNPQHIIAVAPDHQTLRIGGTSLQVNSDDMRASAVLGAGLSLALRRANVVGEGLRLRSGDGWEITADGVRLASSRIATDPETHAVALEVEGLAPDPQWIAGVEGQVAPPARLDAVRLDAAVTLDRPLDRTAIGGGSVPQVTALNLNDARIVWGDMTIRGDGALTVDAEGYPEGRITMRAENWRGMVQTVVALGMLSEDMAETWTPAIEVLEQDSGTPGTLQFTLRFEDRQMNLGALPLGPAPRLLVAQ